MLNINLYLYATFPVTSAKLSRAVFVCETPSSATCGTGVKSTRWRRYCFSHTRRVYLFNINEVTLAKVKHLCEQSLHGTSIVYHTVAI